MDKYINKIENLHPIAFVLLFWLIIFIIPFIVGLIGAIASPFTSQMDSEINYRYTFLVIVIAPIVETYLFQRLPIEFFKKRIKSVWIVILISAALFGIAHMQSLFVILQSFVAGVVLAVAYLVYRKNHSIKEAFWVTAIIHSLKNLSTFILLILLEGILRTLS